MNNQEEDKTQELRNQALDPYGHIKELAIADSKIKLTKFRRQMAIRQIILDHQEICNTKDDK